MEKNQKLNWYIGHMKKTTDILISKRKDIDFVIEVLDARLPNESSNQDLIKIFNQKPIIKIALKSDLIDKKMYQKDFFYASTKNYYDRKKIINFVNERLVDYKKNLVKKGLKNPVLIGIVVGLPNIGKSSLINFLTNKKILKVENRPGVTKNTTNIKISDNLFLIDTPGVFFKNIDSYSLGLDLALIKSINQKLVDKRDLVLHLFNKIFQKKDLYIFREFLNLNETEYDLKNPNLILEKLLSNEHIDQSDYEKINHFLDKILKKITENDKIKLIFE